MKMTVRCGFALLLGLALSPHLSAETQRYALLTAISDYPELAGARSPDLISSINDATAMKDWLVKERGFDERQIVRLYNSDATTRKITGALDTLARKVRPGDVVVIYFSGHGTQLPDESGDEADSLDEAFVTYDMVQDMAAGRRAPERWLTDDVLGRSITRLRTNRVLVVFDCCHSGTATKGFDQFYSAGKGEEVAPELRSKWLPFGFEWREKKAAAEAAGSRDARNGRHVYVGACQDNEQAITVGMMSVLTRHFLDVARERASEPLDLFMEELRPKVASYVDGLLKKGLADTPQTPVLDGETSWSLVELLAPNALPASKGWAIEEPSIPAVPKAKPDAVKVIVTTDKAVYRVGDRAKVTVTSDQTGYLRLYYVEAFGVTKILIPNERVESPRLEARKALELPREKDSFAFEMSPPFGQETIKAVVSTTPFDIDEKPAQMATLSLAELGTRGIRIVSNQKIGTGYTYYQVLP